MIQDLRSDIRWALRQARRRPAFAIAVTTTLAATIAAATTAFGLATAVLWRTMPFDDAARLVFIWEEVERDGLRRPTRVTGYRYTAWRDTPGAMSAVAVFGSTASTIDTSDGATTIRGVRVSANYFDTLGVRPLIGRTFVPGDEAPGAAPVVLLSHGLWQSQFGGRREAIGETMRLGGAATTIVGVMPPTAYPAWPVNPAHVTLDPDSRQFWVPIPVLSAQTNRFFNGSHVYGVLGRLAPGVSVEQARDVLQRATDPSAPDPHGVQLTSVREQFVREARTPLVVLLAAAIAVLLVACANLAGLFVSAFESRRGELALRLAIGAGIGRLIRLLVVEASLLGGIGAVAGVLLARAALAVLPGLLPPSVPFLAAPAIDFSTAAAAIGLCLLAGAMLVGWPAARLMMSAPSPRGVAIGPRPLVYRVLVVSQIGVTVALVVAAALLTQSLRSVRGQPAGFAIDNVLVANVGLPANPSSSPIALASAERAVLDRLTALPNVRAVAAAYDHPLGASWSQNYTLLGDAALPDERRPGELRIVSPGYFQALELALVEGRVLDDRDNLDRPGTVVVNEAFAREVAGPVLGRHLRTGLFRPVTGAAAPDDFEIVGVVGNERFRGLEQPSAPAVYMSTRQFPQQGFVLLVRTVQDPLSAADDVRVALRAIDPGITMNRATSLSAILSEQLVARRVTTDVVGGFAGAALAIAALGLYGLLAMLIASRRTEIAVKLALGASPAHVARRILGDSLRNAAAGTVVGGALAIVAGRLIESLLVGVSAWDARTLTVVAATMLGVAAAAAIVPAARAARIDPVHALRGEQR